jgi:hypothetical protein
MPRQAVRVRGYRELVKAFDGAEKQVRRDFKAELRDVAEPVRAEAALLAATAIPRIGLKWSRMRVGVTSRVVYVAPTSRSTRDPARKRPNLAPLLMGRAMEPALQHHQDEIVGRVDRFLDRVGANWEH